MTKQEQLEILQTKLDEARASMGLPQEALGDGTFIKLIFQLMSNPELVASIKLWWEFFKTLMQPTTP